MAAFEEARGLVDHTRKKLSDVRRLYDSCLQRQNVGVDLQIEIKNFLENLRSALDYAASGLFEKYGACAKKKPKIHFPYADEAQSEAEFQKSGRIEQCIPGLSKARPNIVDAIIAMQHSGSRGHAWMPAFMALTNENKHQKLTPQVRNERPELNISSSGASMSMGAGASIQMGPGASMRIGGALIRGGQTFSFDRPPVVHGGRVERRVWVSFQFESNGALVMPFLEAALDGVDATVKELGEA